MGEVVAAFRAHTNRRYPQQRLGLLLLMMRMMMRPARQCLRMGVRRYSAEGTPSQSALRAIL
eukprot:COSAG02_NODE_2402_length_8943_cov_2.854138_17_plen_62_part_00